MNCAQKSSSFIAATVLLLGSCLAQTSSQRTPWTTSRIHGTPEPPPPFRTERAFPGLTFQNPLDIAFVPGSDRVVVVEQHGRIYSFPYGDEKCSHADLFADLSAQVKRIEKVQYASGVGDCYAIAFDPHFERNHFVYICYILNFSPPAGVALTPKNQFGSRISRFTVTGDPPHIDPASEQILITWFAGGHNGCCIKFGPDGYLYISTGDGGDPDPPDPFNTGQDISDLLCSILRIDVSSPSDGKPYSIPPDNPFIHTPSARPEVFAYGLRNPWRMSFDSKNGNLWVGDVGWELWESIFCVKPGTNCGWSIMEGPNPVHPNGQVGPTPITPPQVSLSHTEAASLTAGIVYHGSKLPELRDYYLFGDWQTSRLWAAKCNGDKLEPHRTIAQTTQRIVCFGEDPQNEPIIVDHGGGGLWRIVRNEAAGQSSNFPRKLSESGLFSSVQSQTPAPGVIPYSINAPQWLDGAIAQRFVAVPGDEKVFWGKGAWSEDRLGWPKDTVFARTISVVSQKIETQLLHFDGLQWQAYSYQWNDRQNDAELVDAGGDQKAIQISDANSPGGVRRQRWNIPSRAQCLTCHNVWCNYVLSLEPGQLEGISHQLDRFRSQGLLISTSAPNSQQPSTSEKLTLTNPYDASAPLYERARSYLHVNCSVCHRFGGGGSALFDVRKELAPEKLNLLDSKPNLGGFGLEDVRLVCPGDPTRSVLLYRMSKLGTGRMPRIGSDVVDVQGLKLLREWIRSLGDQQPDHARRENLKLQSSENAAVRATVGQLLSSTDGAMALLEAIDNGNVATELQPVIVQMAASQPEQVRDLFRRFDPNAQAIDRLGPNINPVRILAARGDAQRGRKVFFEPAGAALCARCHRINGQGTDFGPDLSHIGGKYTRADLLDNILNPSKTIAPGFATYMLRTQSGDIYSGLLVKQSATEIVLKDATLKQIVIPAAQVEKIYAQPTSSMPEGLLSDLTPNDAANLLQFLTELK